MDARLAEDRGLFSKLSVEQLEELARDRATCTNKRSIKRVEIEARVLQAMQKRLFERGPFDEFCKVFVEAVNEQRREHRAKLTGASREIAAVDRRSKVILKLLLEGFRDEA
jgi:3-methyladenine DNA glycosylase Tag